MGVKPTDELAEHLKWADLCEGPQSGVDHLRLHGQGPRRVRHLVAMVRRLSTQLQPTGDIPRAPKTSIEAMVKAAVDARIDDLREISKVWAPVGEEDIEG